MHLLRRILMLVLLAVIALPTSTYAETAETPGAIVVLTPAEQADFVRVRTFVIDGVHSSDARVRGLAAFTQRFFDEATLPAAQRVSIDTLADLARGSTDPIVLSLLVQQCGDDRPKPKPSCDARELAHQWTVADTQNQVAWLTLARVLRSSGDESSARAAFERGARASTWHEPYDDGIRAVAATIPGDLGSRARIALLQQAMNSAAAWLTPSAALMELNFRCKDMALQADCRRVIDTIDRDGGSMFSRRMATSIGRRSGLDAETMTRRSHAMDALSYASIHSGMKSYDEIPDPAELTRQADRWNRRVALGEIAWMKEELDAQLPTQRAAIDEFIRERDGARERAAAGERRRAADPRP